MRHPAILPSRALGSGAGLLFGILAISYSADAQTQARRADDFVNSIGVCTHWDYTDTPYFYAYDTVFARLKASGIKHVRDGVYNRLADLSAAGIGSTFMVTIPRNTDGDDATVTGLLAKLKGQLAAGYRIDGIEGPNEPDLFWRADRFKVSYKGQGWQQGNDGSVKGTTAFMRDVYRTFKADPIMAAIPVFGPAFVPDVSGATIPAGSLEAYVDFGNFHPYPGPNTHSFPAPYAGLDKYWWQSTHPSANITEEWPWQFNTFRPIFGKKPMVSTETGYSTWKRGPTEAVEAKYTPRLFLEYFRLGIEHTYKYELVDLFADPNGNEREHNFGLLRHDLSPKPAYTALQSLINLLEDPGGDAFAPAALDYAVAVTPPAGYERTQYVKHQLFQKRDGKFYLVIYHDITAEDASVTPHRVLDHPPMPTSISLPASIKQVTRYSYGPDFRFERTPLAINSGKITLGVTDFATVLELESTVTGVTQVARASTLSVFPNPAVDACTVRYEASAAGPAELTVVDVVGRVVARQGVQLVVGRNDVSLSTAGLSSGRYFVRLTTTEVVVAYPLSVKK